MHTKAVGGFASLHNFPAGRTKSIWGNALTLFRTAIGTPYFFNFHLGENGNTLIVGPEHSGKATLINFLISEASKYKPQMFVLDYKQCSRLSVKALGGCYRVLSIDETSLKHNPLLLDDNTANRDFLAKWLGFLIYGFKANSMDQHTEKLFTQVVNEIFRLEPSQRRLRNIAQFFTDPALLDGLAIWHSGGIYASLFDNEQDEFNQPGWFSRDRINAIDISWIFEDDARLTLPVITYYLHQFNIALDHHPDMIVIHEAWQIFSHGFFNSYLKEWLRYLVENNAMALLSIQINASEAQPRELADILIEHCATKVYLPTEEPLIYKRLFKLSDQELAQVKNMKVLNRHFLLQQDEDSVVAELNLAGLDHIVAILSSDPKAETLVEEVITEKGEKPEDWLPVFYQRYK